jgi:hypothetical protein
MQTAGVPRPLGRAQEAENTRYPSCHPSASSTQTASEPVKCPATEKKKWLLYTKNSTRVSWNNAKETPFQPIMLILAGNLTSVKKNRHICKKTGTVPCIFHK